MKIKNNLNGKKGITLIALTVTIVVLIILASISIGVLGGEDGLIEQAKKAKEETEISEEKELLGRVTVQVAGKDVYGNIEEEALQKELDKDGKIGEVQEIIEDKNPGDITKDKDGNELDGSEEKPYEIWCIEDLIDWSLNYKKYQNLNVILCRNLNFKSNLSYANSQRTDYGDINGNDEDGNILINELTTGTGFKPIANFDGKFNGQGYEIKNIYINIDENAGLFSIASGRIENLKISGNIISLEKNAGGIVGGIHSSSGKFLEIYRCENKAKVISLKNSAGGIIGNAETAIINECYNYGDIYSYGTDRPADNYEIGCAGGIIGTGGEDIQSCGNEGNVTSQISAGGIIGYKYMNFNIVNCYNSGEINGTLCSGGIIGETKAGTGNIYNSYNKGNIYSDSNSGGIVGLTYFNTMLYIYNSCNIGKIEGKSSIGGIIGYSRAGTGSYGQYMPIIKNTYSIPKTLIGIGNFSENEVITSETNLENIINSLNNYIDNEEIEIDKSTWKHWQKNSDNDICLVY